MTEKPHRHRINPSRRTDISRSDARLSAAAGATATRQSGRHGFAVAFLDAMHEWRQRQAAREIQYYAHLIHAPRHAEGPRTNPSASDRAAPRSPSGKISAGTAIVIAILIVFAVLHIIGGVMIMERSGRAPGEATAATNWGD